MVLQNLLYKNAVSGYLYKNPLSLIEVVISTVNFFLVRILFKKMWWKWNGNLNFEYIKLQKTFDLPNL